MKIHPTDIEGFDGDLEKLGHLIGGLRYDKIVNFLISLRSEIHHQSIMDEKINRHRLASLLCRAENELAVLISTFKDIVDGPCRQAINAEIAILGNTYNENKHFQNGENNMLPKLSKCCGFQVVEDTNQVCYVCKRCWENCEIK